jgi:small subunit ribosomal protein S6
MGKRRLAYTVRKFADGIYILFNLEGPGAVVKEFERRLRVAEQVIKFISVRTDEEEQRLTKIKAIRDSHQKGRGTQAQAAAQQAQQQQAQQAAQPVPLQAQAQPVSPVVEPVAPPVAPSVQPAAEAAPEAKAAGSESATAIV